MRRHLRSSERIEGPRSGAEPAGVVYALRTARHRTAERWSRVELRRYGAVERTSSSKKVAWMKRSIRRIEGRVHVRLHRTGKLQWVREHAVHRRAHHAAASSSCKCSSSERHGSSSHTTPPSHGVKVHWIDHG